MQCKIPRRIWIACVTAVACSALAQSQTPDGGTPPGTAGQDGEQDQTAAAETERIPVWETVVTGTRSKQDIRNIPAAITVVNQDEIVEGREATNLEEALRRVPGLKIEDELGGVSSRTRITIRGVGTRANSPAGSGVRGVKVLVDGIPKNNAGGSAQDLINIDLESAERIEVLRGPSSVLYGNQAGGVVNIITRKGTSPSYLDYRQLVGSYGLSRERLEGGGEVGMMQYIASVYRVDQQGYRQSSRFNSTGGNLRLDYNLDTRSGFTTLVSFEKNFQKTPGPLTAAQVAEDPRQAEPTFLANDVQSYADELRLGLIYRRQLLGPDELEVTGYYAPRHLGPFQQIGVRIPQDFMNRGANARYLYAGSVLGFRNRFTVGADFQDTPIATGTFNSTTGAAVAELEENATTFGAYALDEFNVLSNLLLTAGGRYDYIHFSSRDDSKAGAKLGRTFDRFTPKVGLTYRPLRDLSLYATYARGFEAPVIGELRILPGGDYGFNQDLNPQTSTNYEIGSRGALLDGRLRFELAAFRQEIRDYISPVGTFPNNAFQNAARVKQYGVEAGASVEIIQGLVLAVSYTYSNFTFEKFNPTGEDFSGNSLPGIPRNQFYAELKYRHPLGLYAAVEAQHVGRFSVNDANTADNPPYTVANARFGYEGKVAGLVIAPFVGFNNITDEKYSAFTLINDAAMRYYDPLPGFNVYGGLRLAY